MLIFMSLLEKDHVTISKTRTLTEHKGKLMPPLDPDSIFMIRNNSFFKLRKNRTKERGFNITVMRKFLKTLQVRWDDQSQYHHRMTSVFVGRGLVMVLPPACFFGETQKRKSKVGGGVSKWAEIDTVLEAKSGICFELLKYYSSTRRTRVQCLNPSFRSLQTHPHLNKIFTYFHRTKHRTNYFCLESQYF